MPAYFFVLLSNWPILPIAFMDAMGVVVGLLLFRRLKTWPPVVVAAAFALRALSSLTRFLFYLTGYLTAVNFYNEPAFAYDPVTGAVLQQTMNCAVAAGGVLTLALLQVGIWYGFTRRAGTHESERP
jgi:hypothetical protein